jgi:protoheme IX farnesyltransferase
MQAPAEDAKPITQRGAGPFPAGLEGATPELATLGDYVALLKPRVMSLAIFTALVGIAIAPQPLHPVLALASLIFIALGAGAAGALNMWYDADIDAIMQRTAKRPIPRGRVPREEALTLGLVFAFGSVLSLGLMVNWMAAFLLALSIAFYLLVYTMWLKRRSSQNIVIGGAAGALPPMIGWAAATGSVSVESFVLFLIIFLWTPPHFWALSLYRSRDYERAGVPMLPVVKGQAETRRQILLYSVAMFPAGLLPVALGFGGALYGAAAVVLGAAMIFFAWRVFTSREGHDGDRVARQLFTFSILYLFALFSALLVEHGFGLAQ